MKQSFRRILQNGNTILNNNQQNKSVLNYTSDIKSLTGTINQPNHLHHHAHYFSRQTQNLKKKTEGRFHMENFQWFSLLIKCTVSLTVYGLEIELLCFSFLHIEVILSFTGVRFSSRNTLVISPEDNL